MKTLLNAGKQKVTSTLLNLTQNSINLIPQIYKSLKKTTLNQSTVDCCQTNIKSISQFNICDYIKNLYQYKLKQDYIPHTTLKYNNKKSMDITTLEYNEKLEYYRKESLNRKSINSIKNMFIALSSPDPISDNDSKIYTLEIVFINDGISKYITIFHDNENPLSVEECKEFNQNMANFGYVLNDNQNKNILLRGETKLSYNGKYITVYGKYQKYDIVDTLEYSVVSCNVE